jgi:tellurite resistance protein TerC
MPPLFSSTYVWARRISIAVLGGTVVLIGVAMIVLPGPAFVVIPAGLAILGLEFAFARRWLRRVKQTGRQLFTRWGFRRTPREHSDEQSRH